MAPAEVPTDIVAPNQLSRLASVAATGGIPGGIPGGVVGGVPGGITGGVLGGIPTLPPPPPPPRKKRDPIRVGGRVQSSKIITRVNPVYPELAKRARVQGIVLLQVVVGEDGYVREVKVIRGHALLIKAAVSAVSKWQYSPTLLNGEAVPVLATVTVNFRLR